MVLRNTWMSSTCASEALLPEYPSLCVCARGGIVRQHITHILHSRRSRQSSNNYIKITL